MGERIAPLLPGKEGDPGRSGDDNRMFMRGCVDRAHGRTVARSAALLPGIGFRCGSAFRRWALKGVFERVVKELSGAPNFEYAVIDGTIVKVHRRGTGGKGDSQTLACLQTLT